MTAADYEADFRDRTLAAFGGGEVAYFAVVDADQRVPADVEEFFEHLDAVAKVADAGALVVAPGDGDFFNVVAAAQGDEEDFGVEAPALDALQLEDGLRGGAAEGFEAALGVGEGEAHDHARDEVEAAAEELAVERLMDGLAADFEPARADGDVGAVADGVEEALGFGHGRGEVRVGEHDDVAGAVEDAVADAVAFAAVDAVFEEANAGIFGGEGLNDGGCRIGRTIVDDQDFGVPALFVEGAQDFREGAADAGAFVEGRNHDGVLRVHVWLNRFSITTKNDYFIRPGTGASVAESPQLSGGSTFIIPSFGPLLAGCGGGLGSAGPSGRCRVRGPVLHSALWKSHLHLKLAHLRLAHLQLRRLRRVRLLLVSLLRRQLPRLRVVLGRAMGLGMGLGILLGILRLPCGDGGFGCGC